MARDLSDEDIKALVIGSDYMAERCVVVALAITADGTKKPVGLWDGSTANETVVRALLTDLVGRGLRADNVQLVVSDGAKALSGTVRELFGAKALIQRSTLHKRRDIAEQPRQEDEEWLAAKIFKAFRHHDHEQEPRQAEQLAGQLEQSHPDAAASQRRPGRSARRHPARHQWRAGENTAENQPHRTNDLPCPGTNRNATRWRDRQLILR